MIRMFLGTVEEPVFKTSQRYPKGKMKMMYFSKYFMAFQELMSMDVNSVEQESLQLFFTSSDKDLPFGRTI